ncbi:MAG TPA: cytochrome b/b6 domain-containing protein [Gaiellales bacterium]|jgi:formate dehydrogenase subunit gamma|nr:cytochrome b/b6 domain-containing protein [Gaiellales bacterium]
MATERPDYVRRFSGAEQALHWLLAVSFLTMLVTGLILYLPSLAEVAANRRLWKSIHLGAALAFWFGTFLIVSSSAGGLRGTVGEIDRFDDDDRRWLKWQVRQMGPRPPQGRFNAGQKLNTAVIAGLMVVFTISGTLMYLQEVDAGFRGSSAILVHDIAMYIAIPLVIGHLYMAVLNPSTRHSLHGMVLGTVRRDWAREHHAKWEREL